MHHANEAIFRNWFDQVWNKQDNAAIADYVAPDVVAHGMGPNGTDLIGIEGFARAHTLFVEAFPDIHITVGPVLCDGDKVSAFLTCRATHKGDTLGIAASGREVVFPAMTIARIENGKIAEGWNVIDLLSVFHQAGALTVSAALP